MFTSLICFIRRCCLGVAIWACAFAAQADQLNPNQVDKKIEVKRLTLHGFSSIEGYPLAVLELRARLDEERSHYGERLTVDELHQIADAMTVYVRGKGFVFHTIYVPPQKIVDGDIRYELREGRLADIHVINHSKVPSHRIERVFKQLLGKMLYAPNVEERVQALKARTGIKIFAFYSRGKRPGEARLNIRADAVKSTQFALKVDNFGAKTSGEHRVIGTMNIKQLTRRFDHLSVALLSSADDTANLYGSLHYVLPTSSFDYEWDIHLSNNQFEMGDRFADLGLEGDSTVATLGISKITNHQLGQRELWRLAAYQKSNNLNTESALIEQQESEGLSLEWRKNVSKPERAFGSLWSVTGVGGSASKVPGYSESFAKLQASVQLAKGVGQGKSKSVFTALLSVQYSDANLPGLEAFSLTGPYGVRGFEPGVFSADSAGLLGLEWSLPSLFRSAHGHWYLEPYLFADVAAGEKNEQVAEAANKFTELDKSDASFSGAGIGLRFKAGKHFSGQLYGTTRLSGNVDESTVEGDDIFRFEFSLH